MRPTYVLPSAKSAVAALIAAVVFACLLVGVQACGSESLCPSGTTGSPCMQSGDSIGSRPEVPQPPDAFDVPGADTTSFDIGSEDVADVPDETSNDIVLDSSSETTTDTVDDTPLDTGPDDVSPDASDDVATDVPADNSDGADGETADAPADGVTDGDIEDVESDVDAAVDAATDVETTSPDTSEADTDSDLDSSDGGDAGARVEFLHQRFQVTAAEHHDGLRPSELVAAAPSAV